MKDTYEITRTIKVIGTLDIDNDGEKSLFVERKIDGEEVIQQVKLEELLDKLVGYKVKIECVDSNDGTSNEIGVE